MANLIPPDAKKEIAREYWFRVVVVWCLVVGLGVLVVALLKVPSLWLIESQLRAYAGAYNSAQQKADSFDASQQTIREANELAQLLAQDTATTPPVTILAALDVIAGQEVRVTGFTLSKEENTIATISVSGVANTRTALANFRGSIEDHPFFAKAELPISNLAKERDITFNISITPGEL